MNNYLGLTIKCKNTLSVSLKIMSVLNFLLHGALAVLRWVQMQLYMVLFVRFNTSTVLIKLLLDDQFI